MLTATGERRARAIRFIVSLGVVSLFADMTYEGARAIIGPYLQNLGASGFEMGLVVGLGEMCAASLRYWSGRMADRTRAYWALAIGGYVINLLAVPALAFAGSWEAAALLVIAERTGKAVRGPSRDVLLSQGTGEVGHGWGFGLHNAMDQTGAVLGPLWVALAVAREHSFRGAFLPLAIPAAAALTALLVARGLYARTINPPALEPAQALPRRYWLVVTAAGLLAFGYLDFPFFAYFWVKHALVANPAIPLIYAGTMAVEGASGLWLGRMFDRHGVRVLSLTTLVAVLALPLGFYGGWGALLLAMLCWGIGTGAHSSCLRPAIAQIISMDKRGNAFGIFSAVWGVAWFAGSALLGWLLDHNLAALLVVGMGSQLAGAGLFWRWGRA